MVVCSLYLLGKAGTGKSSTGNTILGQKIFTASSSTAASTTTIQKGQTTLKNSWSIEVVDGPGLVGIDTGFSSDALSSFKEVVKSAKDPKHGHVFLIVCRYGERFTSEDSDMVKQLEMEFGEDVFDNHGIVVVTCGDNFASDFEGEGARFESWCKDQGGDFDKLVSACGGRAILVDNSPGCDNRSGPIEILETFISDIDCGRKPFNASPKKSSFLNNFNTALFKELQA